MVNEDKMKALDAAISNIEKQFGKGSVMKLGDSATNMNVECIPTGSLSLDIAFLTASIIICVSTIFSTSTLSSTILSTKCPS